MPFTFASIHLGRMERELEFPIENTCLFWECHVPSVACLQIHAGFSQASQFLKLLTLTLFYLSFCAFFFDLWS